VAISIPSTEIASSPLAPRKDSGEIAEPVLSISEESRPRNDGEVMRPISQREEIHSFTILRQDCFG
jgi:hypothetical protein